MSPEQKARYTAEAVIRNLNVDYMATVFGVSAATAASEQAEPLTAADVEAAIALMESMPKPKEFTAAQLLSVLRQVLIECMRLQDENKRMKAGQ
jgi:hypothetical protein